MKNNLVILIGVVALLVIISGGIYIHSSKTSTNNSCYANQGEICPTDEFISEYKEVMALQDEVKHMAQSREMKRLEAKSDQFKGMAQRLGSGIPEGYMFDEKKMKFIVARNLPVTSPTPVPPTPPNSAIIPAPSIKK